MISFKLMYWNLFKILVAAFHEYICVTAID